MMHTPQARAAKDSATGIYNFDDVLRPIHHLTLTPDLMVGNLETPVTGDSTISGFPNFDAPVELLDTLYRSGFDMLQTTNNHTLDQGVSGAEKTLQNIDSRAMIPVGGTTSPALTYTPVIQTVNGISVGFIAATFGFNGYQLPNEKLYLANSIDIPKITAAIQGARDQGADIVIVMPHFGVEYQRTPNAEQKAFVNAVIDAGADAVIGTHPHVIQPTESYTTPTGNTGLVAWSLGNFMSNQQDIYTDVGMMITLEIERALSTGQVSIKNHTLIPLYTHKYTRDGKKYFEVVELKNALTLPDLTQADIQRIEKYLAEYTVESAPAAARN